MTAHSSLLFGLTAPDSENLASRLPSAVQKRPFGEVSADLVAGESTKPPVLSAPLPLEDIGAYMATPAPVLLYSSSTMLRILARVGATE